MANANEPPGIPLVTKYKFRDMKVHSSDEWMADATKKYRRVFDRYETTWMRVELSFYNKLFDEVEWEASFRTKCYVVNGSQRNEISNYEERRKVTKEENIVYIRHSWGTATPGGYWNKGIYVWEGYVDDVKIGETTFYIEDVGQPVANENLYFEIESLKLFEGDGQASGIPAKKYLKTFSKKETRYIWGEFCLKPKVTTWFYAELMFNFYDQAGQCKGSNPTLVYIAPESKGVINPVYAGWGGETPDRWEKDLYTLEIVFMDTLIATVPFEVGDAFEEGTPEVITDHKELLKQSVHGAGVAPEADKDRETILRESLEELNALTGLDSIKKEVNEMVTLVQFYQETGQDVLNTFSLHTGFIGNPGTGKTTIARILSKVYKGLGILEKGHLVEVDRDGLVAVYVGHTAIKTGEKIKEAMGGILFIDEAYSLAQGKGSQYDFGGEAIQVLLKRMEDLRGKFGVIVAGYPENMFDFINSNPGLRSRFDKYFVFEDYTPEQMWEIAMSMLNKEGVTPDQEASNHLKRYFKFLFDGRDEHFGNARTVRQTISEAVRNQQLRLARMKKEDRTPELMASMIMSDVAEFELKDTSFGRHQRLGFVRDSERK